MADKVWLVVTPENPIKAGSKISSFNHRFNMAKIATEADEFEEIQLAIYSLEYARDLSGGIGK